MFAETSRNSEESGKSEELEGQVVMEGVEHMGQYVYAMQNAKFEALKKGGGEVREVAIIDGAAGADEDEDDVEDNVLLPEEVGDDFDNGDEEEDVEVKNEGRHLEIEAQSVTRVV